MMNILRIQAEVKLMNDGAEVTFVGGLDEEMLEILNEKEFNEVKYATEHISKIVGNAMERDLRETIGVGVKKSIADELYDLLNPEEKKKVDELDAKLKDKDSKEQLEILLDTLKEELLKKL